MEHTSKNSLFKRNNQRTDDDKFIPLKNIAHTENHLVFNLLQSDAEGLTDEQAEVKLKSAGRNTIIHEKAPSWLVQLLRAFISPFNAILFTIAAVTFFMDVVLVPAEQQDYKTIMVVLFMILLSSVTRFFQEFRSNRAAEKLKRMVKTTATVIRKNTGKKEIDISELVPGDIVALSAGDMIPADCRIIHSKDLFISESVLTGESLPVEKNERPVSEAEKKSILELNNLCFLGTNVVSGSATAIVVTTGNQTYLGSVSKAITGKAAETGFEKGVIKVSMLLVRFMLVMVPIVFLVNGLSKGNWVEALLFAIAVAVGLTPEMLPMIVTTNLAKGAITMSREKVIVKRLNAIQNIGAMNVLCTDKTGTLTLDKIVLTKHLNVFGDDDDEVLKWAYLNSFHQTSLKNLMDIAILDKGEKLQEIFNAQEDYRKVDEIPFDFSRRRMSVILEKKDRKHLLICKGAVEEMLSVCTHAFDPGEDRQLHIEQDEILPMDEQMRQTVLAKSRKLNEEGLRVLLVAIREFDAGPLTYSIADESNMIFAGFIGFLDPAKPSAGPSIAALQELGVTIKVLTGDNATVAKKICRDVGIPVASMLLGSDLEQMTDEELKSQIDDVSIFAKLTPMQKSRIVKALQAKGNTVGFMGDGINDAPGLRDADVGISIDTAVDIAKESADIILLEKDLTVLRKGVVYGRRTFGNIIKYIKMAASSNFGNMFSVLGASALLPFLPMLPVQILVQNLLYDFSQASIPWDTMDEEFIKKPRKWDASGIARFMVFIGPVSSLFDYITFGVLFIVFQASTPEHQGLFQSGWFLEGLLSQTLIVHMIRTEKIPFIQSRATAPVLAATFMIMAIGIFLPFSPLAGALKMQPLPLSYFLWLIAILLSYSLLTQGVKVWYIRRFHQWL